MIRVTHAYSDAPEVFHTSKFGVEHGVLHIFDPQGTAITHLFNRDAWATVEAIPDPDRGPF